MIELEKRLTNLEERFEELKEILTKSLEDINQRLSLLEPYEED